MILPDGDEDEFGPEEFEEPEDGVEPPEEPEEPEEGDDEPPAEDDDPEPPRRASRAEARIEALNREVREARERAEAAERRANEILQGQNRTTREEQERREAERLAAMAPEERAEHLARLTEQRTTGQIEALRREIADSSDRAEFAAACASSPSLAKVKDRVEEELRKLRAAGTTVPRETLAKYLIGEEVLKKAPKARARAEKRAADRLDRERARPAGGASDAPRNPGKDEKAERDKRLENYTF